MNLVGKGKCILIALPLSFAPFFVLIFAGEQKMHFYVGVGHTEQNHLPCGDGVKADGTARKKGAAPAGVCILNRTKHKRWKSP